MYSFDRKSEGRKWVLFFQDTNGLLFNVCTLASLLCYNFTVKKIAFFSILQSVPRGIEIIK